jgi:hypothetical protein
MEMTSALTFASPNPLMGRSVAVKPARRSLALLINRRVLDVAERRLDVRQ